MYTTKRLGWLPDLPDQNDKPLQLPLPVRLPPSVDLRAAMPPIYDQGNLGSCHDDKTEVLTDRGFKLFSELDGSERLATVDPVTARLYFEVPVRLIRFPYTGSLHCADNQSLNFRVTPDHMMLVRKWDERARALSSAYSQVPAKDIGWYAGLMNRVEWQGEVKSDYYTLPGVQHKHKEQREPVDVPMKSWVRFLGLYLAEGTMLKRDQRQGVISYKIQIAAAKEREKALVRQTLQELGVTALELSDRFTFSNKRIYEALSVLGLEGVKAGEKFVPTFIYRLNAEMIAEFLSGHFAGDGSEQSGVRAHYTSSSRLASDLQALIFMSGNETKLSVRPGRTAMMADGRTVVGTLPEHRVSVCERKNLSVERKEQLFLEAYDGEVFCAEVPTYHTLVTRREGKILISGNCTANAIAAALQYDMLLQKEANPFLPSRLFIYYGERVIEHSTASDSGAMIRDGFKTINKQGYCAEASWPYDIAQFAVRPPKKCFDAALKYKVVAYRRVVQTAMQMKACLATSIPFVIGFTVYESFMTQTVADTGVVPMPKQGERVAGGHAVLCCGYTPGLYIARNSWGDAWGKSGYFTIPEQYFEDPTLASDLWTVSHVA